MVDGLAVEQRPDDLQCLGQHRVPLHHVRPRTDHVLAEVLPSAQPEREPPLGHQPDRGRLLRHHGRVVPPDRARHERHQPDRVGGVRGGAQYRPRIRRVPLLRQPGVVVVRADREIEAGPLGAHRVVHQIDRAALLAHERVSELNHRAPLRKCRFRKGVPGDGRSKRDQIGGEVTPIVTPQWLMTASICTWNECQPQCRVGSWIPWQVLPL